MLGKRIFDLVFTVPGIIILAPLLALIAVIIKLDSSGPLFFRQARVGRFGKLFYIYKFRTMVVNAEQIGRQITVGEDRRITQTGRFLRRYKLDELPQLLNVLTGEMSLVGPRPEVPKYVALYPRDLYEKIFIVPPGITDLASIEYRDENEILGAAADPEREYIEKVLPVKLNYYVKYVNERSLWLDFVLILRTIGVVAGLSR